MKPVARFLAALCFGLLSVAVGARAAEVGLSDSLRVSLLTCEPGRAIYELYGHTAIRVENLRTGADWVFNYGVFDFDKPHFVWRFALGRTDYTVGVAPFDRFAHAYARDGRGIKAQTLNLTQTEAARLVQALEGDALQPGWTYRYNFLYDNCTTRAVDQIARCVEGRVEWPAADTTLTFRRIIHQFADANAWDRLMQDLVLGTEVDAPIGLRQQMFSPVYASRFFDGAVVAGSDGSRRPLVARSEWVVPSVPPVGHPYLIGPLAVFVLLVVLTAGVCLWEQRHRRVCRLFDDLLLLLQGLAGCIVAFLFFLSEHPAVGSNWLVLLLNPLPLIYLPWKLWRDRRGLPAAYPQAEGLLVLLFLAGAAVTGQKFPAEVYLLALILLMRSGSVLLAMRGVKHAPKAFSPLRRS